MSTHIDDSIPILTEVIPREELPAEDAQIPVAEELRTRGISEEDWQKLELTLRENVLKQVLSRIDFVLEHRVRDSLADVLQLSVEKLAVEIRAGLHATIEEVITRAVTQEISKVKTTKIN